MEFKVNVDGIERIVTSLNADTTVEQLITFMAKMLNNHGKHVLVEMKKTFGPGKIRIMNKREKVMRIDKNHDAIAYKLEKIEHHLICLEHIGWNKCAHSDAEDFINLLKSIHLQQVVLNEQSELLTSNEEASRESDESNTLLDSLEARLTLLAHEIVHRRDFIRQLEHENQMLNCELYKIKDGHFVNLEQISEQLERLSVSNIQTTTTNSSISSKKKI